MKHGILVNDLISSEFLDAKEKKQGWSKSERKKIVSNILKGKRLFFIRFYKLCMV